MSLLDAMKKAGLVSSEKATEVEKQKTLDEQKAAKEHLERLSQRPPSKRHEPETGE